MENITRIREALRSGHYTSNPHGAAEDKAVLAGEYSWVMGMLEQTLQIKPEKWNQLRKDFKSDTACERAWESTKDGINEMGLKLRAKGLEKMMSALGTLVNLAQSESKNML